MVATGFINSVLFGLMGICKARMLSDPNATPTIPQVMWCGASTGNFILKK